MNDLDDVVLRALEPKDVNSLYSFRNDWQVAKLLGGFSAGYSRANLEAWIRNHVNRSDEALWTIADKATDESIGHVGLYDVDYRLRKAEFAIVIGYSERWNTGIGTRVSEEILGWAFDQLNLHKVSLVVLASNARAIHVYERLGFKRDGLLRDEQFRDGRYIDIVLMSLLEDEWRRRRRP
jgi:RimJ/RimL family protein N-acetyltransferase